MDRRESMACTMLGLMLAAGALTLWARPALAAPPFPGPTSAEMRVATIGYRLAGANVSRCLRLAPLTGLLLHDRAAYPPALRDTIGARFDLGQGMGVLGIVPGSPADRAGLKPGDEVIALGGADLAQWHLPPVNGAASYARIEAFVAALAARLREEPTTVTVRRGVETRDVTIPRETGCDAAVAVVPGDKPDAWSDARYAAVTQGLVRVAGDDELAFALAHEMAHVLLDHAAQPHGALTAIGIGGKRSRDRERAADRLGIALVQGAGYDPSGARLLLERFSRVNGPGLSLTHPTVRSRLDAMRHELGKELVQQADRPPDGSAANK